MLSNSIFISFYSIISFLFIFCFCRHCRAMTMPTSMVPHMQKIRSIILTSFSHHTSVMHIITRVDGWMLNVGKRALQNIQKKVSNGDYEIAVVCYTLLPSFLSLPPSNDNICSSSLHSHSFLSIKRCVSFFYIWNFSGRMREKKKSALLISSANSSRHS